MVDERVTPTVTYEASETRSRYSNQGFDRLDFSNCGMVGFGLSRERGLLRAAFENRGFEFESCQADDRCRAARDGSTIAWNRQVTVTVTIRPLSRLLLWGHSTDLRSRVRHVY